MPKIQNSTSNRSNEVLLKSVQYRRINDAHMQAVPHQ